MPSFTLTNTSYPDGTSVNCYDATGYSAGFPGANPPGNPVETATAQNRSVTFSELEVGTPYIAGAKVGGEWRYVRFAVEAPVAKEALSENGIGVVFHGNDAAVARPDGFRSIIWKGVVEPTNAIPGDEYEDREEEAAGDTPVMAVTFSDAEPEKGGTYTFEESDAGKVVITPLGEGTEEEPETTALIVPPDEDVDFPVGTMLGFLSTGEFGWDIRIKPGEGVTLRASGSPVTEEDTIGAREPGQFRYIVKTGENEWDLWRTWT